MSGFPVLLSLTDDDAMMPGTKLADVAQLKLVARISATGNAIAAPGDVFGELEPPAGAPEPLTILIDTAVE